MSTVYDIVQTVELINFAANGASDYRATQAQLQICLNSYLSGGPTPIGTHYDGFFPQVNAQLAGGDWSVAWGPVVYSRKPNDEEEAANAMYVAYSPSLATYVVAIAATNPKSMYDWLDEDGDVAPEYMAEWPPKLPFARKIHLPPSNEKAYISAATALGISNLLTKMSDPNQGSLQNFLTHKASKDATLIFTGHSLAGALAPTTALYLYPKLADSGWKQVLTLPTAGASPGNSAFAALFAAAYPAVQAPGLEAEKYGVWNIDYANANDVVPHAWNQLDNVVQAINPEQHYPSFFGVLGTGMGADLTKAIALAKGLSGGSNHYLNLTQTVFTPQWGSWKNTWNSSTNSWDYPAQWETIKHYDNADPLTTLGELGDMILATHISQYLRFFNLVPPPKMATAVPSSNAANAAGPDARQKQALLAAAKVSQA